MAEKAKLSVEFTQWLFGCIDDGRISSWVELLMMADLSGYEINESIVHCLVIGMWDSRLLNLIVDTISNTSYLDEYMESEEILEKLIVWNDGMTTEGIRIDTFTPLLKMDIRNPRYLLKFFLNFDYEKIHGREFGEKYFTLFKKTLNRTRIRAEKAPCFIPVLKKLEEKFNSDMNSFCIIS